MQMGILIGILYGLAVLFLVGIAGVVVHYVRFGSRQGAGTERQRSAVIGRCPLCGGSMQASENVPHIMHCTTPKCPNC